MVYPIGKRIVFPFVRLWIEEIKGLENVPREKGFIIAANHASYFDHYAVGAAMIPLLNKKVHFLSKKEHFDNPLKAAWHTWTGAIPLDRQKGGKEALRFAIKALKQGKIIAIHPEGTRSLDGKLMKGKTGVARLALKSKAPVVPVGLIGTFGILPKGKYIPQLKKAVINIGKPIHFIEYHNKKIDKKMLREVTNKIMKEIARLSKQEYKF